MGKFVLIALHWPQGTWHSSVHLTQKEAMHALYELVENTELENAYLYTNTGVVDLTDHLC